MNSTVVCPELATSAHLGGSSFDPEDSSGIPELHLSDEPSSGSNSHLPSPDNVANNTGLDLPSKEPMAAYARHRNPPQPSHHPYSRISISDLVNPSSSQETKHHLQKNNNKKRRSDVPTLEQSIRYGLQMVQHQRKIAIATGASTNTGSMVSCLVDLSVMTVELVWGSGLGALSDSSRKSLHHYVTELFRRSRVTKVVVQFALIFCLRVKDTVALTRQLLGSNSGVPQNAAFCGRRMFLASLICASKFLQDSNFSNKTWARIVGLSPYETSLTEFSFLRLLDYKLFVQEPDFYPYARSILDQSSQSGPVPRSFYKLVEDLFQKGSPTTTKRDH